MYTLTYYFCQFSAVFSNKNLYAFQVVVNRFSRSLLLAIPFSVINLYLRSCKKTVRLGLLTLNLHLKIKNLAYSIIKSIALSVMTLSTVPNITSCFVKLSRSQCVHCE